MGFLSIALAAIILSFVDVGRKRLLKQKNEYIVIWGILLSGLPILIILNIVRGLPTINAAFWPNMLLAVAMVTISEILLYKAIKLSDISYALPFVSFAPVFSLLTAWIILGEFPNLWGFAGVIVIFCGAWFFNLKKYNDNLLRPFKEMFKDKGSLYIIIVSFIWSVSANFEKTAIQNSSPLFFTLSFALGLVTIFSFIVLIKYRHQIKKQIRGQLKQFLLAGTLWSLAAWLLMVAYAKILVAYVLSIKQTRMIYDVVWGKVFFKEENIKPRLFGTAIMILGVLLIVLFN